MPITINSGTTFLMSDRLGNVAEGTEHGMYFEDTRCVSRYELLLNGQAPLPLTARVSDPYAAVYFLTNRELPGVAHGQLGIIRHRRVTEGAHEDLEITNYSDGEACLTVELVIEADFAHLFEVRRKVAVRETQSAQTENVRLVIGEKGHRLRFCYRRGSVLCQLMVRLSQAPAMASGGRCTYKLRLAPRETWRLHLDLLPQAAMRRASANRREQASVEALQERQKREHAALLAQAPRLETDHYLLTRAYLQSVSDFAALRIQNVGASEQDFAVAAGIPWFMTLFGRDSLIAAYQALPFFPVAAKGTLRALAQLQGSREDSRRAEEPGKILHEHRYERFTGTQMDVPRYPYYGTVDATPLFLMLLAAVHRITGDLAFVRSLRENALRALIWMDRYADRDGDGYVEYLRDGDRGLDNQGWKDSGDAIRFSDGTMAQPPIALCEVQGYAYAARVGMAAVFDALDEPERASELRAWAVQLKRRFNRDFWMADRGYFALALDGHKRQVDAITSNPGHLLWTGIADEDKAALVARRLLSPELFSGWGVRTMATTEGGYNPISYHNGSVWPHDNSLAVAGLARYGFHEEAATVTTALLHALSHYSDHRLPELFSGYSTTDAPTPVEYLTANRPQAWASGTIFLLLACMVGVNTATWRLDGARYLPAGAHHLRLDGILVDGQPTTVEIARGDDGTVARSAESVRDGGMAPDDLGQADAERSEDSVA
jgi:glycogen debranching enzyme